MWMAWQHTTWMTNWFDPNTRKIRIFLFILMLIGLIIAAAIPDAFGDRGLIFALCYIVTQIGRSGIILFHAWQEASSDKELYSYINMVFYLSRILDRRSFGRRFHSIDIMDYRCSV